MQHASNIKKTYVCGFLFDTKMEHIALVLKSGAHEHAGLYNGLGGKVEAGESSLEAMIREFQEESGVLIQDWKEYASLEGKTWISYFFFAKDERVHEVKTMEEGLPVRCFKVAEINKMPLVSNARWLVPMCMDGQVGYGVVRVECE